MIPAYNAVQNNAILHQSEVRSEQCKKQRRAMNIQATRRKGWRMIQGHKVRITAKRIPKEAEYRRGDCNPDGIAHPSKMSRVFGDQPVEIEAMGLILPASLILHLRSSQGNARRT